MQWRANWEGGEFRLLTDAPHQRGKADGSLSTASLHYGY